MELPKSFDASLVKFSHFRAPVCVCVSAGLVLVFFVSFLLVRLAVSGQANKEEQDGTSNANDAVLV